MWACVKIGICKVQKPRISQFTDKTWQSSCRSDTRFFFSMRDVRETPASLRGILRSLPKILPLRVELEAECPAHRRTQWRDRESDRERKIKRKRKPIQQQTINIKRNKTTNERKREREREGRQETGRPPSALNCTPMNLGLWDLAIAGEMNNSADKSRHILLQDAPCLSEHRASEL